MPEHNPKAPFGLRLASGLTSRDAAVVVAAIVDRGLIPRLVRESRACPGVATAAETFGVEVCGQFQPYPNWPMQFYDHTQQFKVYKPYRPPMGRQNEPPFGDKDAYKQWQEDDLDATWDRLKDAQERREDEAKDRERWVEEQREAARKTFPERLTAEDVYRKVREAEKAIRENRVGQVDPEEAGE